MKTEGSLIALLGELANFEHEHDLQETFNIFDAVGMRKQEIRHSRFLAFLLNPAETHGLGAHFLQLFLDNVMAQYEEPAMSRLAVMIEDLESTEVYSERDNFDITVWLPIKRVLIVIENKIGSTESEKQLATYRERVKNQYPETHFCGVFLTADGYDGQDEEWVSVGYSKVYEHLTSILSNTTLLIAPEVRASIKQYAQLIRRHIVTDEALVSACKIIYAKHRSAMDLVLEHGRVSVVREASQRFLQEESSLKTAARGSQLRVNFVPRIWTEIAGFQVAADTWEAAPCPLMLWFELHKENPTLAMFIEVGPFRNDAQFARTELVQKLRTEFSMSVNGAISPTYTRIKRRVQTVDRDDMSSVLDGMKSLWKEFGGTPKVDKIARIIKEIVNPLI